MLSHALLLLAPVAANDIPWPEYRGPDHDGSADGADLPLTWSEKENVTWKVPVDGRAWSSPVVGEGRIWLTNATTNGTSMSVIAFDLGSGERVFERVLFTPKDPEHRNSLNSYASPSPYLTPGRVFVHFGTYGTVCIDAKSGEELWRRDDLHCDHMEGPGSSPLVDDGRVYLNYDGGDVQYVVALDAKSGETVWRTDRTVELDHLAADLRKGYNTPLLVRAEVDGEERLELISTGAQATYAYDPESGSELWRFDHPGFSMSSRPVFANGTLVVNTGFMRPELWAVKPGGSGVLDEDARLWRNTKGAPTMPSPVTKDGLLFQISDRGMLSCVDLANGESVWRERAGGEHCASLLRTGDRIYTFSREGKTVVFRAGREYEKLAESRLTAGIMASPAVAGDALIVRTETHLYRIEDAKDD